MTTLRSLLAATLVAAPALAQSTAPVQQTSNGSLVSAAAPESAATPAATKTSLRNKPQTIQHLRFNDQRGLNVFESPKEPGVAFTGFKLDVGAAFTQQFQGLGHRNRADSVRTSATVATNANRLIEVGHGFNNATANVSLNAQLAKGIRVALTSYLSSRHHNETWVKDGYFLIDDSPIALPIVSDLMQFVTLKVGHFEVNYGDQHFRRTDNGNAIHNPLVGNLLIDAFTTSVGAELYVRHAGFLAMGGVTNGEVRGMVLNPTRRAPAFLGKVGWDGLVTPNVRVRLTGSAFSQARSANQTLFTGDRAGSRYYDVLENSASTEAAQAWSGNLRPDLNELHAVVINPFVKVGGLELFGNFEKATGRSAVEQKAEADTRAFTQVAYEATYRLLDDAVYVSGRYNLAGGRFASPTFTEDSRMTRRQMGGGWFLTPTVLLKGEWVNQSYTGFPTTDLRSGGRFEGFVVEGVVAF